MLFPTHGVLPDPVDPRDWEWLASASPTSRTAVMRQFTPPVPNQGRTGSCVAHAVTSAFELCRRRDKLGHVNLSAAALWFATRQRMNPPVSHKDNGTSIWLALNTARKLGIIPDFLWPWDADKLHTNPGPTRMHQAVKLTAHYRVKSTGNERVRQIIGALAQGHPVVYSTEVGDVHDDYQRGDVLGHERNVRGRHAEMLYGYNSVVFEGMGSWGTGWGDQGHYLMDPEVIASDATTDVHVIVGGLA